MIAFKLVEHEKNCKEGPVECKYCGEKVPQAELLEHMQVCGAKTYLCEKCGEWVKRAERREHEQEGFCDVIRESKAEAQAIAAEKEKKAH